MKTRLGFVSNSSASSFIIAIGKIIDREKFDDFIKTIDMRVVHGFKITSLGEILDNHYHYPYNNLKEITIKSFDGTRVTLNEEEYKKEDEKKDVIERAILSLAEQYTNDIIMWHSSSQDIGWNEETNDYDYDIDISHFSTDEQNLFEGLNKKNGVVLVDKKFGAGYDG